MVHSVKTIEEAVSIANNLRHQRKIVVTTNGSFDILHIAHVNLLEKAKAEGDALFVLVNSDNSIRRFKGDNRPIIPQYQRAELLAALKPVDYVVIFSQDTPLEYLTRIKPHVHVKGGTYIPDRTNEEKTLIEQWGGRFKFFSLEEGFSTTNIIETILQRYGK